MLENLKRELEAIEAKIKKNDYDIIDDIDKLYEKSIAEKELEIALRCLAHKIYVFAITSQTAHIDSAIEIGDALLASHEIEVAAQIEYYNIKVFALKSQGKLQESLTLNLTCLELCEKVKNIEGAISARMQIADIYADLFNYEKAEGYLKEALATMLSLENPKKLWWVYYQLGVLYIDCKRIHDAREMLLNTIAEAIKLDHLVGKILGYQNLAEVELLLGNKDDAMNLCNKALKLRETSLGLESFHHSIIMTKVLIHNEIEEFQTAIQLLDEIFPKLENERAIIGAHQRYIEVYEKSKDYENALKHERLFTELKEKNYGIEAKKHAEEVESKYQNQLKEREKEILRLQKVEMEQKAIRAQLNPHFFFNALNSINKFILDNDQQNASKFLQNFSGLMRKTLENSEEMFITIEDEVAFLKDYLSLEQLRCNNSFTFHVEIDEEIEEDFVKIPTMLLQPYVENAIKHGVNGMENGKVILRFELDEQENLLCTVEDNGKGINSASKKPIHKSMATKLLQERIVALQEQFQVAFKIETINLAKLDKSATGTRVEIFIPSITA